MENDRGSLLDSQQAADLLNIHVGSFRRYVRRGYIEKVKHPGSRKHFFRLDAVQALKERQTPGEKISDPFIRIKVLEMRLAAMERRVRYLSYVSGMDVSSLASVDDEGLAALFREADQFVKAGMTSFPLKVINIWAETFLQITSVELARLARLVLVKDPWRPFYRLCLDMQLCVRAHPHFSTRPALRETYALLEKARKGMAQAILISMSMLAVETGQVPTREILSADSAPDQLRRLVEADSR